MEPSVAIVSERFWRSEWQADPAAIGRIIDLNRIPLAVVGVAPDIPLNGAAGDNQTDIWIPYTMLGSLRPADDYFADIRA